MLILEKSVRLKVWNKTSEIKHLSIWYITKIVLQNRGERTV